jgi:tRNA modification GTPase
MRFDTESTICAIATGTEGAIRGAIRLTGPNAVHVAQQVCNFKVPTKWESRIAIRFPEQVTIPQLGLVDVFVYLWPDHRSYTGQPTVEFHCLGNVIVLQSLQAKLIAAGSIMAQPGEFTLRAFLAGRLDLTQCEAVLGVIHAANDKSLNVALSQLAGGISTPLSHLRTSLVHLLADIEAGLDFVDEDIEFISRDQILSRLSDAELAIANLLSQMESRASQTFQLQVAIVGPPNAGKSTLLNMIGQRQVSIVSETPGTTRDYVRLRLELGGVQVDIVDTAGIEESDLESPRGIAQQFTREQIANADLILYCLSVDDDASVEWQPPHGENENTPPVWLLRTKCDLPAKDRTLHGVYANTLLLSQNRHESVEPLLIALQHWANAKHESVNQVVPITAARCQSSLQRAIESIAMAHEAIAHSRGDEVVASEIRIALEEIGMVAGTVYTDDILDALFSRFCIGK